MIQLTKPVLIAVAAGIVAIGAIAVSAWRLSSVEGVAIPGIASQEAAPAAPPGGAPSGAPAQAPAASSQAPAASSGSPAANQAPAANRAPAAPQAPDASQAPASQSAGVAQSPAPSQPPAASQSPAAPAQAPAGPSQQAASATPPSGSATVGAGQGGPAATAPRGQAAPGGTAPQGSPAGKPTFDVVRVDPQGDAVVAGRAPPRSRVALTLSGKPVAQAEADAEGQFVMLPPSLPPGDHVLGLRATSPTGEVVSEQSVAIAVPQRGGRETIAALSEPNKPTVVLSQSAAPVSPGDFRIVSVEAQQGGALFASGVAPPGSNLRLYLNEAFVAPVEAGPDGKWSVRVERGMAPGSYRVRADRIGGDGRAVGRIEAPFDYPVRMAASAPAAAAPEPARPGPAAGGAEPAKDAAAPAAGGQNAVVPEVRTARVERGDSLWRISRSIYGEGLRYTQIYDANTSQIRDPDLIFPGQILVVPKDEPKPAGGPERRR